MTIEEALKLANDLFWQEEDHSTYTPSVQALLVLAQEIERRRAAPNAEPNGVADR